MRISDWSSDVCSSDLAAVGLLLLDEHRGRAADLAVEEAGKRPFAGRPQAGGTRLAQRHGELRHPGRRRALARRIGKEIGRAHVCTPVANAHLVCRLLLEKKNTSNDI